MMCDWSIRDLISIMRFTIRAQLRKHQCDAGLEVRTEISDIRVNAQCMFGLVYKECDVLILQET